MKAIKKVIAICVVALSGFCLFAQSESYKAAFKAAQEAESKKQWIRALGNYLDAMELDIANSKEAVAKAIEISNAIESGNPGLGKFNPFQLPEGWKALFIDAEQYFTEVFPYEIYFNEWEQTQLNYKTQTADYEADVKVIPSCKYDYILRTIEKGYGKAKQNNWEELGLPKSCTSTMFADYGTGAYEQWPYNTVQKPVGIKKAGTYYDRFGYKDETDYYTNVAQKSYMVNGVPITGFPAIDILENEYGRAIGTKEFGVRSFINAFATGFYDVSLKVTDDSGNVLVAPKRYLLAGVCTLGFTVKAKNIPADKMEIFDEQKAKIAFDNIYLQYGYIKMADWNKTFPKERGVEPDYVAFKYSLPELAIDLKKAVQFSTSYKKQIYYTKYIESKFGRKTFEFFPNYFVYRLDSVKFVTEEILANLKTIEYDENYLLNYYVLPAGHKAPDGYEARWRDYANILDIILGLELSYLESSRESKFQKTLPFGFVSTKMTQPFIDKKDILKLVGVSDSDNVIYCIQKKN